MSSSPSTLGRPSHSHHPHPLVSLESQRSADPEEFRPTRPPSTPPPAEEDNAPPPSDEVTTLRLGAHYGGLVLASMVGCLVRLGLDALGDYNGRIIFPLAWPQGVGCGIMGLALARKNDIVARYPPLYTFFTTGASIVPSSPHPFHSITGLQPYFGLALIAGIAGSVTTFSSWMIEGYMSFANLGNFPRSTFHSVVDGFAYSFSTFAISMACLLWGEYVASILPAIPPPRDRLPSEKANGAGTGTQATSSDEGDGDSQTQRPLPISSTLPTSTRYRSSMPGNGRRLPTRHISSTPLLDSLTISTGAIAYLIALILYFYAPSSWRHRAIFPILLSPPGAILRFLLARINTKRMFIDRFPLGTFMANVIATLVLSGVYVAQRRTGIGNGVRCNALYGIQQGFCGCLSTVSTFVVEARAGKGWWKWVYVGGSVVLGQVLVMAVVGGAGWGEGYGPVCSG